MDQVLDKENPHVATAKPAFEVSVLLSLASFNKLDLEDQFCLLAERLCVDLEVVLKKRVRPYNARSLVHFRALPPGRKASVVGHLKTYYLTLEAASAEGILL